MNLSKLCEKGLDGVDEFVGESLSKSNEYSVYVNNDAIGSTCNTSCLSLWSSLGRVRSAVSIHVLFRVSFSCCCLRDFSSQSIERVASQSAPEH